MYCTNEIQVQTNASQTHVLNILCNIDLNRAIRKLYNRYMYLNVPLSLNFKWSVKIEQKFKIKQQKPR